MKKNVLSVLALVAVLALGSGNAFAAAANGAVDLDVTIGTKAKLTLTNTAVTFDDSALGDPDTVPSIDGDANTLVDARVRVAAANASLTVAAAAANFTDGTNNIPVGNVSWVADNDLAGGSLSIASADLFTNKASGTYSGTMDWKLLNSWSYVPGNYAAVTVNYTLSAP